MIKFIEGMPSDVLAVEVTGKVTEEDYRKILVPRAKAMMAKGPIRILYVAGKEFIDFEFDALWDDTIFGFKYEHDFNYIAVVTSHHRIINIINMLSPFLHACVRVYGMSELPVAKEWISNAAGIPHSADR